MDDPRIRTPGPTEPGPRTWLRGAIILVVSASLLASAVVYLGYHAWIAFDADDTNHLETPLALAVARQLHDGPSTLYGPFSGTDPLVLIHAPLYYRLAGLGAWPIARMGASSIVAALIAGRTLSLIGMILILIAAGRIATQDRESRLVGAWAALLTATSPVFGSFAFTVRPDTLGIAFQTIGFGLVLRAILSRGKDAHRPGWSGFKSESGEMESSPSHAWSLPLAGLMFGLAVCAKQHLIVAAGVAAILLLISAFRGRLSFGLVTVSFLLGLLVPAAYYGWEQYVTDGRMADSVVQLPSQLRKIAPADWSHVREVFLTVAKLSVGLIALALSVLFVSPRRAIVGTRLDATLWVVLLAEIAAMIPLCLGSTGAWVNYAMPAFVWAAILVARAAIRVLDAPKLGVSSVVIGLAAFVLFANDVRLAEISYSFRRDGHQLISQVLADPTVAGTPRNRRYFVGQPQLNRLYGRTDLAHDEWLYASYEAAHMAEPRSQWLLAALTGNDPVLGHAPPDPVTLVVVPSDLKRGDFVYGLDVALPHLGYKNIQQYGRYAVWLRRSGD
ncbi:MAG: hypothetical protein JWN86_1660 [Planctomycetota bacterium]|nr:hypothetical protein [Planctomycetota bacterium]